MAAPSVPGLIGSPFQRRPVLATLGALLVLASCLAVASLSRRDHVYSIDQLDYHERAVRLSQESRSSFVSAAAGVAHTIRHEDYNDLAAVPLAVWVSLFGEHRQSFVVGVLILYAIPASALFAALMCTAYRRICGQSPSSWLTAGWLLTPWLIGAFWTPTILGRVGVGGLGLLFAAVALHIRRPLEAQRWWEPVAVGGLLAAAFLFRRWYVFAVIGILVAIGAQTLLSLLRQKRPADRQRIAGRALLVVLTLGGVLMACAMPMVARLLREGPADALGDYHHPGSVMYLWGNPWSLAERLGLPSLLVVLAAFTVGLLQRQWRGFLVMTTLAGAVSLALFSRFQAPGVHHILLWVGVECVVLGIGLAQLSTMRRTAARVAIAASVLILSTSVASVLFLSRGDSAGSDLPWWNSLAPTLTVGDFLPDNLEVVRATVEFLETNVPAGASIAFLSSGLSLNDDLLRNIRFSLPGCDVNTRYRILPTRRLRRDGGLPFFLLRAEYVVVVDPPAFSNPPRPEVARVPAEWLFRPTSPFAACFQTTAGPTGLPGGRTITAFRLRKGMYEKAQEILAEEVEAVFVEHRASDLRP